MTSELSYRKLQRGVTLVEILVTVVIISVGLLGIAALHTLTLKNGLDAHTRTQATAMANDIIDRMRANPTAAKEGAYDLELAATPTATGTSPLADKDKVAWINLLGDVLPQGDGAVARSMVAGERVFTVTVQWRERESSDPRIFTTTVEI